MTDVTYQIFHIYRIATPTVEACVTIATTILKCSPFLLFVSKSRVMHLKRLALLGAVGTTLAQRPSDVSICDYYTTALLKQDTPANQYTLLTLLVNTVVIGNYTQPNVGVALPGILAPATYNGEAVNLLPYFNGCFKSTNVNNVPSYVNFLDGGGAAALEQDLPAFSASSNQ
jgi:hypothetical protein